MSVLPGIYFGVFSKYTLLNILNNINEGIMMRVARGLDICLEIQTKGEICEAT